MVSPFQIRTATIEDIPLIRQLSYNIWPQVYRSIISPSQIDYMLEWMYNEEALSNQMVNEGITYLLIENDKAHGFAAFGAGENKRCKLHKLYVSPAMHGKGLGRMLVLEIIKSLPNDCIGLELQVNKNNPAQNFYTKLGFTVEKEAVFDIGNGYVMDDYIMFRPI
jgi:diamine N-acetyltransferase